MADDDLAGDPPKLVTVTVAVDPTALRMHIPPMRSAACGPDEFLAAVLAGGLATILPDVLPEDDSALYFSTPEGFFRLALTPGAKPERIGDSEADDYT